VDYTGDTELYPGLSERFFGCDYLIVNCLKPEKDNIPDHLDVPNTDFGIPMCNDEAAKMFDQEQTDRYQQLLFFVARIQQKNSLV